MERKQHKNCRSEKKEGREKLPIELKKNWDSWRRRRRRWRRRRRGWRRHCWVDI